MQKEFELSKTRVAVNSKKSDYVPGPQVFLLDKEREKDAEKVLKGIQMNFPVLLIGPTGSGKTSLIRHLANKTNNAYRRVQLTGSTGIDNFVGRWLINSKGTYWQDGILTDAMRKGEWVLQTY